MVGMLPPSRTIIASIAASLDASEPMCGCWFWTTARNGDTTSSRDSRRSRSPRGVDARARRAREPCRSRRRLARSSGRHNGRELASRGAKVRNTVSRSSAVASKLARAHDRERTVATWRHHRLRCDPLAVLDAHRNSRRGRERHGRPQERLVGHARRDAVARAGCRPSVRVARATFERRDLDRLHRRLGERHRDVDDGLRRRDRPAVVSGAVASSMITVRARPTGAGAPEISSVRASVVKRAGASVPYAVANARCQRYSGVISGCHTGDRADPRDPRARSSRAGYTPGRAQRLTFDPTALPFGSAARLARERQRHRAKLRGDLRGQQRDGPRRRYGLHLRRVPRAASPDASARYCVSRSSGTSVISSRIVSRLPP